MAINILHIIVDDKFPKGTLKKYSKDDNLRNSCVIFKKKGVKLKYVEDIDGLTVLSSSKEIKKFLITHDYDFVFLYSLPVEYWPYIKYIPKEKKIIWWAWGYDLYHLPYGLKPFIRVNLYKPITQKWIRGNFLNILNRLSRRYNYFYYAWRRKNVLMRIDYFQPVISLEYKLMIQNKGFRAKEYYYYSSFQRPHLPLIDRDGQGDIIFCNSAHPTNNHLDVAVAMNKANLSDRTIHIPVSYGALKYKDCLKKKLHIKGAKLDFLEDFIPKEDYFQMLSKCSYFVSGVMRQQSMANVSFCMLNGIKVFLYKDSLPYIYLKEGGYFVYAIENIDEDSFCTPLTIKEAEINRTLMEKEAKRREHVWNDFLLSIS